MKKIIFTVLASFLLASNAFSYSIADGEVVLDKVFETGDLGDTDYSCTITLVSEKPGSPKEQSQFKVFERIAEEQFSMIQILPEASKGNGYLKEGDNLWYYDPIGRKFSHTSLKENIGDSDAKVSDIATSDEIDDGSNIKFALVTNKVGETNNISLSQEIVLQIEARCSEKLDS